MKWVVRFNVRADTSVEVEGEDRWAAVVAAAEKLGLDRENYSYSSLFSQASVRKLDRKKRLSWWEKETEE